MNDNLTTLRPPGTALMRLELETLMFFGDAPGPHVFNDVRELVASRTGARMQEVDAALSSLLEAGPRPQGRLVKSEDGFLFMSGEGLKELTRALRTRLETL